MEMERERVVFICKKSVDLFKIHRSHNLVYNLLVSRCRYGTAYLARRSVRALVSTYFSCGLVFTVLVFSGRGLRFCHFLAKLRASCVRRSWRLSNPVNSKAEL
jgi:predicted exporter